MGLAGGWTLLSALPMEGERLGASRGSFASHWRHDRSVVAPAEVVADGGGIVAFEIEEAPGDVEGVCWIQEQAEAGMGKQ
jgi:hypothetical protein